MNLCTLLGAFIQTQKTKSYKNNKSTPAHSPHINIRVQKWTFKLDINNRIASVKVSGVLLYISPIPYQYNINRTDFHTNDNNSYGFYESPAYRVQNIRREADIGGVFTIIENEAQTRLD